MVGGVGNRAAEEDWRWDLSPGMAAITGRGSCGFGRAEGEEDQAALAEWRPSGGDAADDARSLNHGHLLLFLRHGTPD